MKKTLGTLIPREDKKKDVDGKKLKLPQRCNVSPLYNFSFRATKLALLPNSYSVLVST